MSETFLSKLQEEALEIIEREKVDRLYVWEVYEDFSPDFLGDFFDGVEGGEVEVIYLPYEQIIGWKKYVISSTHITTDDPYTVTVNDVRALAKIVNIPCRKAHQNVYRETLLLGRKGCSFEAPIDEPNSLLEMVKWLLSFRPEYLEEKRKEGEALEEQIEEMYGSERCW